MEDDIDHASDVEIHLLGAAVTIRVGARDREFTNDIDRWLLTALVLAGSSGVTFADIKRDIGLGEAATRQRITRLRAGSGLEHRITSVRGTGYRLDTSTFRVDVLEFLRLVETLTPTADARRAALRQARSMLTGGLPRFSELPLPHAETYARFRSAEYAVATRGQRILVIDDQVGHSLADRLSQSGDHICDVATSFREYRQFENRLGDFDLVIVDRHLEQGGYNDRRGDEIVEDIGRRPDGVPVMMITFDVPDELDLTVLQETYGLAGAQRKREDGERADLGLVVSRVEEILLAGPVDRACAAVQKGMVDKKRRAQKRLERKRSGLALSRELGQMGQDAAKVCAIAETNDMQKARMEQRSFVEKWLEGVY